MNPTYGWRKAGLSFVGKLSADDLCVSLGRAPSLLSCPKHLSTRPCCARKCVCTIWQNAKTSIAETFSLEFWTKEVPRFSKFVCRTFWSCWFSSYRHFTWARGQWISLHSQTKTAAWDCDIGTEHPDVPTIPFPFFGHGASAWYFPFCRVAANLIPFRGCWFTKSTSGT